MSRRKSAIVLLQPATSMLRRSARLTSLRNRDERGKPGEDLVLGSEPPRKSRRRLRPEVSNKFVYHSYGGSSSKKSPGSSQRRSLRLSSRGFPDASEEKSPRCSSTKPASTSSSTKVSSSCSLRRSPWSGGGSVNRQSSSDGNKSGNSVLSRCSTKSVSSERGKGGDSVKCRDRSRSRVIPKTKQIFKGCDDEEEEVSVCLSERKRLKIESPNVKEEEEDKGLKTKNKLDVRWTKEVELALQGAYLAVKPSPNFWKRFLKWYLENQLRDVSIE